MNPLQAFGLVLHLLCGGEEVGQSVDGSLGVQPSAVMVTVVPAVAPRLITASTPVGLTVLPLCPMWMVASNRVAVWASLPAGRACRWAGRTTVVCALAGSEFGLDSCDFSNVVVVRPSPSARADGARPVWFGGVLGDAATRHVVDWVAAGGPGRAAVPAEIAAKVLERTKTEDLDGELAS